MHITYAFINEVKTTVLTGLKRTSMCKHEGSFKT